MANDKSGKINAQVIDFLLRIEKVLGIVYVSISDDHRKKRLASGIRLSGGNNRRCRGRAVPSACLQLSAQPYGYSSRTSYG